MDRPARVVASKEQDMNDKQLLKDAAKAAGIEEWLLNTQNGNVWDAEKSVWRRAWNPLIDDGDALRLAVKLRISVWVDSSDACCSWVPEGQHPFSEGMEQLAEEITNDDPYAATRLAIGKAAAE
jgi:hypothetical protein